MSGALISIFANQRGFATVPGAPTIGTATSTGATTISVTFTAPASDGGSAITSYTATSSPGGLTGTSATSPITVSGLTTGTAYTFTVTATNSVGTGPASSASNSATPVLALGNAYQGGYYAGQISTSADGVATHNLVVAPKASGQNSSVTFKSSNTNDPGATSAIDGPSNSSSMNDGSHPAASFCEGLTIGGYSDWYLPARLELDVVYYGLKPTTDANAGSAGTNANSVPKRTSNYSSGTPAQTSATDFITGGSEAFTAGANGSYWTSTQIQYNRARSVFFANGNQNYGYYGSKTDTIFCRAIRRVAL